MRYAVSNISNLNLIILFILSVFLTSCVEDEPIFPNPTIRFNTENGFLSSDSTILLNDSVYISIIAETNSNDPLTHFNRSLIQDSQTITIDSGIYTNTFTYEKQIVKGLADIETWSFFVRDRNSRQSETISINLHLDPASFYGEIIEYSSIIMGAQENNSHGSFYSLSLNQVFPGEDALNNQSLIHMAYFYDLLEGEDNTIASPGANIDASVYPASFHPSLWTIRNTTRFEIADNINPDEFEESDNDSLILANTFEFMTGKRKAKNLTLNDIYSFVTDDGKKGLLKVVEVNDDESGTIEISIKIQKQ